MSRIIPGLIDLQHLATWVLAVTVIAVFIGAFLALVDHVIGYGWPRFRRGLNRPVARVRVQKRDRAASHVVDIDRHRRIG